MSRKCLQDEVGCMNYEISSTVDPIKFNAFNITTFNISIDRSINLKGPCL